MLRMDRQELQGSSPKSCRRGRKVLGKFLNNFMQSCKDDPAAARTLWQVAERALAVGGPASPKHRKGLVAFAAKFKLLEDEALGVRGGRAHISENAADAAEGGPDPVTVASIVPAGVITSPAVPFEMDASSLVFSSALARLLCALLLSSLTSVSTL